MPLIIPVGFGQAVYELRLTGDSEPMVVTMGHSLENAGGDFQECADDLHLIFGANVMPALTNDYTFTGVTLYVGQDGGPPLVVTSVNSDVPGAGSASGLPQNCAMLWRKRTDLAGRRGRGRIYLPGLEEGLVNEAGIIESVALAAFQAQADAWYAALNDDLISTGPYTPVVLHRSEGIGVEPPPTVITLFEVDELIATQRGRLRR